MSPSVQSAGRPPPSSARSAVGLAADALGSTLWSLAAALGERREGARDGPPAPPAPRRAVPSPAGIDAGPVSAGLAGRLPFGSLTRGLRAAALDLVTPVLQHIDVNALIDRLDVQRIVDRLDVAGALRRVDLDEVAARVDMDALLDRVDLDRVLASVDPNRLLDRVDVDALVRRVDLAAAAREAQEGIDVGDAVDEVLSEGARAHGLGRIVDRLLSRSPSGRGSRRE